VRNADAAPLAFTALYRLFFGIADSAPASEGVEILWEKFGAGQTYAPNLVGRFYAARRLASD
jgi:hypothetical protein